MNHLVFLSPHDLRALLRGHKRVESRLWTKEGHPCTQTSVHDLLYFKAIGGAVQAVALVEAVEAFGHLTPAEVVALARRFAEPMAVHPNAAYWRLKRHSRAARFFWLSHVRPWHIPASHLPRGVRIAWVADWQPPAEAAAALLVPEMRPPPGRVVGDCGSPRPLLREGPPEASACRAMPWCTQR